ncbi:CRISPR-associated helicase, Cas3 family [Thermoanaerobacter uzonensis DSM 18761]|uniref:CRISPR-associated helicase, Cas3 family n=1 Tax=Thermoanaerobacter uzonensis DSM 18761 TaxID=1123369 RepID=A0A1M4ZSY0_9THEO|nr:CRISPR-associated helicase/endonuclease Cas3 [Thermoanaerobacter uzonensis]SHF21200.1 CRISPR-associated helicase, Cas3 family [Thermoanaerobacter uzonensis DSM 18761]
MEYYAHYDQKQNLKQYLSEHLLAVKNIGETNFVPSVSFQEINNSELKELIKNILFFHDFGKYTTYFQNYLVKNIHNKYKEHAHISACIAYLWIKKYLFNEKENITKLIWAFLAYVVILRHHMSLEINTSFDNEKWGKLEVQVADLRENIDAIVADLNDRWPVEREEILEILKVNELKEETLFIYMPQYISNRFKNEEWYFASIYLFSLLIDSDKLDSGTVQKKQMCLVEDKRVEDYIKQKHKNDTHTNFASEKNEARKDMIRTLQELTSEQIKNQHFFTITAPTGIGKTLASLQCALYLRNRIKEEMNYTPRIITAIPFINIIEQTQKDYEAVVGNTAHLIVHHQFADFENRSNGDEIIPVERKLLEVEAWEGDIILTTFVQLFQSLLTDQNRLLKKINKLAGSIVILDEIQSIPDEYMPLIGAVLRKLAQFYGTRFILMTATQPKILQLCDMLLNEKKEEPIELLKNHDKYFKNKKRTILFPLFKNEFNDGNEFVEFFMKIWQQNQSALIVVNTIKRSIEIFNLLREKQQKYKEINDNIKIYYLSTNIIPKHREKVIEKIKKNLENKEPVILVSTQTIEAGVDLDFDIGFRDLAPLESIIQTAGRVNREGKKGEGAPLYILKIDRDYEKVYHLHHIDRVKKLLADKECIWESEYKELVEKYYEELIKSGVSDKSQKIWEEGIIGLDFTKLKEFELIKNIGEVVDVFVEIDDEASVLLDAYEDIKRGAWGSETLCRIFPTECKNSGIEPTFFKKRALLQLLLKKMRKYIIQIRINRALKNPPIKFSARNGIEANFYWIPKNQVEEYYDFETGFIDETAAVYIY